MTNSKKIAKNRKTRAMAFQFRILVAFSLLYSLASEWHGKSISCILSTNEIRICLNSFRSVTLVFEYWYYKYRKNPKIVDVAEAESRMKTDNTNGQEKSEKGFLKNALLRTRNIQQYPTGFRSKF